MIAEKVEYTTVNTGCPCQSCLLGGAVESRQDILNRTIERFVVDEGMIRPHGHLQDVLAVEVRCRIPDPS